MQSKQNWPKPLIESASADYSLHTREKGLAEALTVSSCIKALRHRLQHKTFYVVEFFDTFKEDNSAFETGFVATTLYVWDMRVLLPILTDKTAQKNYWSGFAVGIVVALIVACLVVAPSLAFGGK